MQCQLYMDNGKEFANHNHKEPRAQSQKGQSLTVTIIRYMESFTAWKPPKYLVIAAVEKSILHPVDKGLESEDQTTCSVDYTRMTKEKALSTTKNPRSQKWGITHHDGQQIKD